MFDLRDIFQERDPGVKQELLVVGNVKVYICRFGLESLKPKT